MCDWFLQSSGLLIDADLSLFILTILLVDQNWLSSVLLSKHGGVWLECSVGCSHGGSLSDGLVVASLQVEFTGEVGADWLGGGFEAKGTCGRCQVAWILTSVSLWLLWDVLLLGDQVVNALVKIDHL